MADQQMPAPGRRDPEGRRQAILRAATEIIVTRGPSALTHRAVAQLAGVALGSTTQYFASIEELRETALADLAQEIEQDLAEVEAELQHGSVAEVLASGVHEFLRDRRAVHADMALTTSAMSDPNLRALALRWTDRLIEILAVYVGEERATAIALYTDGATIHAGLHDAPMSARALQAAIQALVDADFTTAKISGTESTNADTTHPEKE